MPHLRDMFRTQIHQAAKEAAVEAQHGVEKFGYFRNAHEGYAVMLEEVDELWVEVKAWRPQQIRHEALQVAAMALRIAVECGPEEA